MGAGREVPSVYRLPYFLIPSKCPISGELMLRISKIGVTIIVTLYTIPLITWLLLRWWHGESWTSVGVMNAIGVWWFVPLLLLLPIALLLRARQALVMLFILLLPALYLFGAEYVPHFWLNVPEDARSIRVLSFNMLSSNVAYDAVIELIREQEPDIIAMQELSVGMSIALNENLADIYPYQEVYAWNDPRGMGIWSRYPLTEGPWRTDHAWERWVHSAIVDIEGQPLFLFNVHLWPTGTLDKEQFARALMIQEEQAQELNTLISESEIPVLVVGDFNSSPTNETHAILDQELDDAWRQVGFGPGFTFPAPGTFNSWVPRFLRIDYFWTKGSITPLKVQVLSQSAGSDHLPLLGEFAIE